MKRCYICSRTLVLEGNNQNVTYLDSEICVNCELTMKKYEKENKNDSSKKHRTRK